MCLYLGMALQKEKTGDSTLQMDHYFLCNYVPLTVGKDGLSRSLLRFKQRLEVDLSAWVECSVDVLASTLEADTVIVRAFGNDERVHTYSALDHIGVKLSEKLHCSYAPNALRKTKDIPSLKTLNRADRIKTMKGSYEFKSLQKKVSNHFLILDDILTTGTTAIAIGHAIKDKFPEARITVFTLAKVDYDLQMNEQVTFEAEHFRWSTSMWVAKEDEVEYSSLSALKQKIMSDSF